MVQKLSSVDKWDCFLYAFHHFNSQGFGRSIIVKTLFMCNIGCNQNKSAFIRRVNKYQSILIGRAVSIILIHSEFYGYDLSKSFWLVLIKLSGLLYILIVLNLNHKFSRIWSQEWKRFLIFIIFHQFSSFTSSYKNFPILNVYKYI